MAGKFTAQVSAWAAETKARQTAIFKESAQRLAEIVQTPGPSVANPSGGRGGHMPIATGFLRASFSASLGNPPPSRENPSRERSYAYDGGAVSLVIAGADIGDTITLAYTANYARFVHRRYQFVTLAAQRWPQIVAEVAAEAQRRAGG